MAAPKQALAAIVVAVALVGAIVGLRPTAAQEEAVAHPAHVHKGTCANLDPNPAYPLKDIVVEPEEAGTPPASPAAGTAPGISVGSSVTTIPVKLADLLAAPYAINVHESAKEINDYIACGEIIGRPTAEGLTIGLKSLGTYGYAGIAVLRPEGDQTTVTVYLAEGVVPTGAVASPAANAQTVAVTLSEMKVVSTVTTFKVGQAYTFVVSNQGTIDHEMVIEKRGDVDKPLRQGDNEGEASDIAAGQTKSLTWTFTEPGAYQLACHVPGHFEAGMVLNIDVTA